MNNICCRCAAPLIQDTVKTTEGLFCSACLFDILRIKQEALIIATQTTDPCREMNPHDSPEWQLLNKIARLIQVFSDNEGLPGAVTAQTTVGYVRAALTEYDNFEDNRVQK